MKGRTRFLTLSAVLALLSLPPLVALVEAVSFHVHNRNNGSIVSSGEKRDYLLYVPESHDPSRPTPLVISLHSGKVWPAVQRDLSGWNRMAESHGFIVVYPAGIDKAWRILRQGPNIQKDVRFISDLIDELEGTYNIDPARIYANGLSNGGGMAFVLSCTLSDRVAAVGMVAAAQMLPWTWCPNPEPVPMISFHGTADSLTPYTGGKSWVVPQSVTLPDISEWTAQWAERNRCDLEFVESPVAPDVTRREYSGCADDAAVVLFTIQGAGHTWPGSEPMPEWFVGPTNRSFHATPLMWAFFQEHRLAGR